MRAASLSSLSRPAGSGPLVLPAEWQEIRSTVEGARTWVRRDGMSVIASIELHEDDRHWLHVSFARPDRLPSWGDIKTVKALFVGRDKCAMQILPPESEYVNEHPFCLHLWHCIDEPNIVPRSIPQ